MTQQASKTSWPVWAVALAVLADRGGRELPIAAEFAAVTVALPQDKTLVLSRQGEGADTRFAFATEARS